jgi:hypothetical protein
MSGWPPCRARRTSWVHRLSKNEPESGINNFNAHDSLPSVGRQARPCALTSCPQQNSSRGRSPSIRGWLAPKGEAFPSTGDTLPHWQGDAPPPGGRFPPRDGQSPRRGEASPSRRRAIPSRCGRLPSQGERLAPTSGSLPQKREPLADRGRTLPGRGEPVPDRGGPSARFREASSRRGCSSTCALQSPISSSEPSPSLTRSLQSAKLLHTMKVGRGPLPSGRGLKFFEN